MRLWLTFEVENLAYECSAKQRLNGMLDLLAVSTPAHQGICIDSNNRSPPRV